MKALLEEIFFRNRDMPGGNILNLLCTIKADVSKYDFSSLSIWQADLKGKELYNVNFAHADFRSSTFTQNFGGVFSIAFSPTGETIATGELSGQIQLWRVSDGQHHLTCIPIFSRL